MVYCVCTGYSFWDRLRDFLHKITWIVLSVSKWVNSGKFMDNCCISCQIMADMKKGYDDLIIINLYCRSDFNNRNLFMQGKMIYAKKMQWTALVEFDKMPAGKALEQKNSTFVIVILRQIVAKKKSYAFFRQQCKCPGLASLWLWFLKKKAGCPQHSCVIHTIQKST